MNGWMVVRRKWTPRCHVVSQESARLFHFSSVLLLLGALLSYAFIITTLRSSSLTLFQNSKPTAIFSPPYSDKMSESNMEKFPRDTAEAAKDQLREGDCKGACEGKPSKRISDSILPHILNLYASRAKAEDFEIYAPHATFEDPLMFANGVKQIKSAFYSLAKIFSESRIVDYSVEENIISPGKTEILIDNKQYYKLLGKGINMISLIRLFTEDGKVVRHEDWWDKKPLSNRDTAPFVGRINEVTRRVSMFVTHAFMRFGKDPTV